MQSPIRLFVHAARMVRCEILVASALLVITTPLGARAEEPIANSEKKAEAKWSVAGLKDFAPKITESENGETVSVTFTVPPEGKRPFFGFVRKFDPPVKISAISATLTGIESGSVVEVHNDQNQGTYRHMPASGQIFFDLGSAVVKGKDVPFEGKVTSISIGMAAPVGSGEYQVTIEGFKVE